MSDLISRQDAIAYFFRPYSNEELYSNIDIEKALNALPSAEQKTGKWTLDPDGMDWNIPAWRCSECGFVANYIGVEANGFLKNPMNWSGSKYCPECGCKIVGARMTSGKG